jgi:membrane-bound serine protease (ClpP class)
MISQLGLCPSPSGRSSTGPARAWVLLALSALAGPAAPPVLAQGAPAVEQGSVFRVPITGVIELGIAPFLERSLEEAREAGAAAVVLDIDTPGGRVDAAERMADAISDSEVPVYAFINRRALSAGALISLAAHGIYMRPGSVIGAATPVTGEGQRAPEKIVSAMRSSMRALAEARALDPAVAEAMVDEQIEVPGISEAGQLLTLTTEEAVEIGYAEPAEDWDGLMQILGTASGQVVDQEVNWAERIVRFFSNPLVSPFLLSLGFLGLLIEIRTPTFGAAGVAGALSLGLFFGSHLIVGLAGLEGLLIFGLGLLLMLIEAFFIPGFGVFGILGGVAALAGVYLSMLGGIPTSEDFARAGGVLTTTIVLVLTSSWFLVKRLPSNRRLTNLGIFLGQETSAETGYTSAIRRADLVGAEGVAITDLRPAGTGRFGDERVDVVTESEWIEHGSSIKIVSSEGYRHVVRLVSPPAKAVEGVTAEPEPGAEQESGDSQPETSKNE